MRQNLIAAFFMLGAALMMSGQPARAQAIADEVSTVINGHFTADSLGTERFQQVRQRIENNPIPYLQELKRRILESDAYQLSNLYIHVLLNITRKKALNETLRTAAILQQRLDDILFIYGLAAHQEKLLDLLGPEKGNILRRLEHQRNFLLHQELFRKKISSPR
jgi:hypothetical protein